MKPRIRLYRYADDAYAWQCDGGGVVAHGPSPEAAYRAGLPVWWRMGWLQG